MLSGIKITMVSVAVFFAATGTSFAQRTYTLTPGDTIVTVLALNDKTVLDFKQVASGTDSLYLAWQQVSISLPGQWEGSLCDYGTCYPDIPSFGNMYPIPNGDYGLMSLHMKAQTNPGTAVVRYVVWDIKQPATRDTVTWIITAFPTGVNNIAADAPVLFAAGKMLYTHHVSGYANTVLSVYDLSGRVVISKKIKADNVATDLCFLSEGTYVVTLRGDGINKIQKIFIGGN